MLKINDNWQPKTFTRLLLVSAIRVSVITHDTNSNMSDYLFIQNLHICSVAWTAQNSPSYHLGGRYSVSACACARTVCYLSAVVAHSQLLSRLTVNLQRRALKDRGH